MINLTPEEKNSLAVAVASFLACDKDKKEIIDIKLFLLQVINNLSTYISWNCFYNISK